MKTQTVNSTRLREARGQRTREVIAHSLRQRGHATDAKAIWRWETRKNQPSARVLPDLAEVLGLEISDLFESDDEDEEDADAMEELTRALNRVVEERVAALREEFIAG